MGKVTGFLGIDRRDRRYVPASDRICNYKEFMIPLSEEATRDQAARCMDCGIPFCHEGCPVNNLIPELERSRLSRPLARGPGSRARFHQQFPGIHRPYLSRAL